VLFASLNDALSYELDALAGWLSRNPTNPLTRAPYDYTDRLSVDTELQGEISSWRARAVDAHCKYAMAASGDPGQVVIHLTNAIEANPRDPEGYERLASHLQVSGDEVAASRIREQALTMLQGLEAASQTYAMNVAGDRAEILPAAPAEDGVYYYEDHDDERELDVGGLMALLAVAQVSKGIVWGIALNSSVASAGAAGAAGTGGAVAAAGTGAAVSMAGGLLAVGAMFAATIGGAHQVSVNRTRKRKSFLKVQRLLGRHR